MSDNRTVKAEEIAQASLFLYRNFSKTQIAMALAMTYNSVRRPLPINTMKEWEGLTPGDLQIVAAKQPAEETNGQQ